MDLELLTASVCAIAEEVGKFLTSEQASLSELEIEEKGQGDFVSRVDRHAEVMLTQRLSALLPGSVVMGEEHSPHATGDSFRWIVDPLDGTTNYLAGLPVYAISIGLEDRRGVASGFGPILLGVVHLPALGQMYSAARDNGASRNGKGIRVNTTRNLLRAILATGMPFRERHLFDDYLTLLRELFPRISDIRRIGSAAADLCWVADGTFDGYFEMDLKPWDLAAGALIVQEAGGIVTDWWGDDCLQTGWVLAGSQAAYDAARSVIDKLSFKPPAP